MAAVPALAAVWREGARFARERMSATGQSTGPDPSDDAASRARGRDGRHGAGDGDRDGDRDPPPRPELPRRRRRRRVAPARRRRRLPHGRRSGSRTRRATTRRTPSPQARSRWSDPRGSRFPGSSTTGRAAARIVTTTSSPGWSRRADVPDRTAPSTSARRLPLHPRPGGDVANREGLTRAAPPAAHQATERRHRRGHRRADRPFARRAGARRFYAYFLWFHWNGLGSVWSQVTVTKIVLAVVFIAIAWALLWVSLFIVDTVAPFRCSSPGTTSSSGATRNCPSVRLPPAHGGLARDRAHPRHGGVRSVAALDPVRARAARSDGSTRSSTGT